MTVTVANAAAAAAAPTREMMGMLQSSREHRPSERQTNRLAPAAMPGKAQVAAPAMLAAAAAATVPITAAVGAAEWQRWHAAPRSTPLCGERSVSATLCRQSCRTSPLLRAVRFVTSVAQAPPFDGSPASRHRVQGDVGAVAML